MDVVAWKLPLYFQIIIKGFNKNFYGVRNLTINVVICELLSQNLNLTKYVKAREAIRYNNKKRKLRRIIYISL